jgi:hypothetical protein
MPSNSCPQCKKEDCDCGYFEPCPGCEKKVSPLALLCPFCQYNFSGVALKPKAKTPPVKPKPPPPPKAVPIQQPTPAPASNHGRVQFKPDGKKKVLTQEERDVAWATGHECHTATGEVASPSSAPKPALVVPKRVESVMPTQSNLSQKCVCGHCFVEHGHLFGVSIPPGFMHDGKGGVCYHLHPHNTCTCKGFELVK